MSLFANWGQVIQIGLQLCQAVGWSTVLTLLVGTARKARDGRADGWLLGVLFFCSLGLLYAREVLPQLFPWSSVEKGITPCEVRIKNIPDAEKVLQGIKEKEKGSFSDRRVVICLDPEKTIAQCPFAQDLQELFKFSGLSDVRVEHGRLEGSSMWFESSREDATASEQFYKDIALRGYDIRHYLEPSPSKPKGKPDVVEDCGGWPTTERTWKFYIKDQWYLRQPQ